MTLAVVTAVGVQTLAMVKYAVADTGDEPVVVAVKVIVAYIPADS